MSGITDAQFVTLERLRAQYPATMTPEQIGSLLNEWAWTHKAEGCGLQAKPGGTAAIQPRTGTHIWNGVRFLWKGEHYGQDVLSGASVGKAVPVRGKADVATASSFVAPVQPFGTVVTNPDEPSDLLTMWRAVLAGHALLEARIEGLEKKVRTLEAATGGALTGRKVRLKTENGHYIVAEGGGGSGVFADRVNPGAWETYTLEETT